MSIMHTKETKTTATLTDVLADIEIDESDISFVWEVMKDKKKYREMLSKNPNLIVLSETYNWSQKTDNDQDCREYKAWNNLLKLLAVEFIRDPYWNSRIGWLMWFWVCYCRYDSYWPMAWCFHYDPTNFYRHDEPLRPPGLEHPEPDDPFNIKGKCMIHPEWYKEDTQSNDTEGST